MYRRIDSHLLLGPSILYISSSISVHMSSTLFLQGAIFIVSNFFRMISIPTTTLGSSNIRTKTAWILHRKFQVHSLRRQKWTAPELLYSMGTRETISLNMLSFAWRARQNSGALALTCSNFFSSSFLVNLKIATPSLDPGLNVPWAGFSVQATATGGFGRIGFDFDFDSPVAHFDCWRPPYCFVFELGDRRG